MVYWGQVIRFWNLHLFLNPKFIPKNFKKKNRCLKQLFRRSCKTWSYLSDFWKIVRTIYIRRRRLLTRWYDKPSPIRCKHYGNEYPVDALADMHTCPSRYQLYDPYILPGLCYHSSLCSWSHKHVCLLENFPDPKALTKRCSKKERNSDKFYIWIFGKY